MKLIIQIPCYNEEQTLPATLADLPKSLPGIDDIEVLIIDDGSSDATSEVARQQGVHHIVRQTRNKGLAHGFKTGIDACLRLGADIIVNTDADNQYQGQDIALLIQPILANKAEIVVGTRPIQNIEHFSRQKKRLQHWGSSVVRMASGTAIPDAPSGFRAYSRQAAMKLNVINEYTYTLETIIQAGHRKDAIASVDIRTNPETRKSRLFKSLFNYVSRSAVTIVRAFMMYKPLVFFLTVGALLMAVGIIAVLRFIYFYWIGAGDGHIQSLVLAAMFITIGYQTILISLQSDLIAANRKILEDVQYHLKRLEYDGVVLRKDSNANHKEE
jgi:glycosyltransferase involved in cell wall biosynthesis